MAGFYGFNIIKKDESYNLAHLYVEKTKLIVIAIS